MSADSLTSAIKRLAAHESLDGGSISQAFGVIMRGEGTPAQVAALLMALRVKGETSEEVAGVVQALRDAMVVLPAERPEELVDTCGTGGGSIVTFNISTAAALLAAGAGLRVAKHGNRSFTSRSGSADVLEALGVPIDTTADVMERALANAGIVFMFAPLMHPALRHVGPIRRELGVPTVMNIVGPLANPARAGRQVVGVAEPARLPLLAEALGRLGTRRALVVHGEPGLDEISPLGVTRVVEVVGGSGQQSTVDSLQPTRWITKEWTIDPSEYLRSPIDVADLAGGSPQDNAEIIEAILANRGKPGARAAVVLNAAAALLVGDLASDYRQAVKLAEEALEGGKGTEALVRLRESYR